MCLGLNSGFVSAILNFASDRTVFPPELDSDFENVFNDVSLAKSFTVY